MPQPRAAPLTGHAREPGSQPARPGIGDQLRLPMVCCQVGSCIARYRDPQALGEADIRARAIAAGWRVDARGRVACPACQQTSPHFWPTDGLMIWDRDAATTAAAGWPQPAVTASAQAAGPGPAQHCSRHFPPRSRPGTGPESGAGTTGKPPPVRRDDSLRGQVAGRRPCQCGRSPSG